MRRLAAVLCVLIYLGGVIVFAWPDLNSLKTGYENKKVMEQFQDQTEAEQSVSNQKDSISADSNQIPKNAQLYQEMQAYNQQIFADGQSGLTDPWSYEQASFPVQGTDSNCVIAAHRGLKGIPMFREIERLEIGDELTVQNCQETLTYRVSEIEIILPDESDKIMIQPGRNMVTLMTCHPYTQNSRRYVVYCDEVGTQPEAAVDAAEEADSSQQEIITTSEQNRTEALEEDQRLIARDTLWRKAGYVGIGLIGVLIIFGFIPRKKH